nr:Protein-disulfide isomerase [Klebsiella pneumoniae]
MADFRRPLGKLAGGGKTGLQIYQQKGADAYLAYHNGIYATGHNEGKLTTADIQQQAKKAGFDAKKAADVEPVLQSINDLAQEIGLSGTPGVIVMPTTGATEASITVFPGWQTKPRWKPPSKKPAANPRRITCPAADGGLALMRHRSLPAAAVTRGF